MATHALKGEGPPQDPPPNEHSHYTDTLNGQQYLAVGTASINDWKLATGTDGGGNGVPAGGDTDDLLTKNSNTDFDTSFKPLSDQPDFQDHETRISANETAVAGKIDEPGTKENRQSLVWEATPGEWQADHRVKWRGEWSASKNPFLTSEMTRDGEWTMIVADNVESTTDRPAPQEDGDHQYIVPDDAAWSGQTDSPLSSTGMLISVVEACRISEIRMWRPSTDDELEYVFTARDITDISDPIDLFREEVPAGPIGWVVFNVEDTIFLANSLIELELVTTSTAGEVEFDRQWLFTGGGTTDPGPRQWNRRNGASNETPDFNINKQDWALQDASVDLLAMKPGSRFEIKEAAAPTRFAVYQVQDLVDQGGYVNYTVELIEQGQNIRGGQLCDIKGTTIGLTASPLVELPNYFQGNDSFWNGSITAQGFRRNDLALPIVPGDNAYGVDVQGVRLLKSDDWDIVAASTTTVGGGGGVDSFIDLVDTPSSYENEAEKSLIVSEDETSVIFRDTTTQQNQTVWTDAQFGDDTAGTNRGTVDKPYRTIKAAVDFVTTQNPTDGNDWVVQVNPGVYVEQPITVPQNTQVRGTSDFKTNVFPADETGPLFTLGVFSNLANLNLDGRVGIFGPASSQTAIFMPFVAGNTFEKLLINNFTIGFNAVGGAGTKVDSVLNNTSIGQLGSVDRPIVMDGSFSVRAQGLYSFAESTIAYEIKNGAILSIDAGLCENASTGIKVENAEVTVGDYNFQNVGTILETDGQSTVIIADSIADGDETDTGIKISGTGGNIQFNGCSFVEFTNIIHIIAGQPNVFINNCVFQSGGDGSKAIIIDGFPNTYVSSCRFFSGSLTNTIAIDMGNVGVDRPFLDINDSVFFNYVNSIDVNTGQATVRHCTFEVFAGPLTGTTGILGTGDSNIFIEQCNFSVGFGCRAQDDSIVRLASVRFLNTETDFEQADQAVIFTTQSNFDEDKVAADNWAAITGNYNSLKPGDRGLICTDKLKVGVAELGQISSFGQGANFTRGMLCYTFNSDDDSFTDKTQDAQDEGGGTVEFPSTSPNSAIYISHTLTDDVGDPFAFSGIWMNVTTFGDVGTGEIISEIWNGSSWQEIEDMLAQAEPPYNQIPRGDSINIPEGKYNFRFDDRIENIWETSDPIGLGFESYWYRFRIKGNWFNLGWSHRTKITAQATAISGVHDNIPLMFDLSTLDQTFWDNVNDNGSDIRVTDNTGTNQLPVEVSKFDKAGQVGKIYFSSDFLSNTVNTDYFVYYGNSDASFPLPTSEFGEANVWTDYIAVYHFNQPASDGATTLDSAKAVKIINGTIEGASITSASDGILDNYYNFNSVDTDSVNIKSEPEIVNPTVPFTMQCLFRDPGGNNKRRLVSIASANTGDNDEDNVGLYVQNNNLYGSFTSSNVINSGVAVNNDQWRICHLTTDGNIGGIYADGGLAATTVGIGGLTPSPWPARIGNRGSLAGSFSFGGGIDEVRLANTLFLPERVTTETTNIFFQNLFFVVGSSETREEATAGGGGDPIVTSPEIDQIKIHPLGFTEIGADGFTQWFGTARPVMPLQIQLASFLFTPATGNTPQTGSELWLTASSGQLGSYYFGQGTRTTMTAVKTLRTELDTSSPIRIGIHFAGLSANAGDVLFRGVLSFSDSESLLYPDSGSAPQSVSKQNEALSLISVEADRLGKQEFVVIEVAIPDIDTQQTYDEQGDLAWLTIERVGDSVLDTYDNTIKILSIQVNATIWRNGSHIGTLGDAPPPGLPGSVTFTNLGTRNETKTQQIEQKLFEKLASRSKTVFRRLDKWGSKKS